MFIVNSMYEDNNFITKENNLEKFLDGIRVKNNHLKRIMRTIPDTVVPPKINLDWVHCTRSYERVKINDTKEEYISAFFKYLLRTNITLTELILEVFIDKQADYLIVVTLKFAPFYSKFFQFYICK